MQINQKGNEAQQNALPQDIHSSIVSPQTTISSKAAAIGQMSAKLAAGASQGRKVQTVARDNNSKIRTQRSTSRGAMRDIRGVRTDRRGPGENDDNCYTRPESRVDESQDGQIGNQDSKEDRLHQRGLESAGKFDGTMKFERQQLSVIGGTGGRNQTSGIQSSLRESHDSMRSIQKQRIQRSLQKSQEGRKKLEEKLEAISNRDRERGLYAAQNTSINTSVSGHGSGNLLDPRPQERDGNHHITSTPQGGSLLATRGGFSNLRNKDQIRDQMLASINKIKSFRETGEIDISGISSMGRSASGSINNINDRITGLEDVNIEAPQDYPIGGRELRCSDQVLMAEPTLEPPPIQQHPHDRDYESNRILDHSRGSYQTVTSQSHQNQAQDNLSNLASLQNFQSTKSSTNHLNSKTNMSNQLQIINAQIQTKVCNNIEEAQPHLKNCLLGISSASSINGSTMGGMSSANESGQFSSMLSSGGPEGVELDKNLICPKCSNIVVHPVECQSCQYIICFKCAQRNSGVCDEENCGESFTKTPGKIHKLYKELLNQLEFKCPNSCHGCNKTLKYDQLDNHLQRHCDAKQQLCPNRCSKTLKFSAQELQKHLDEDCPKECLPCPQCKQIKFRMEIQEHLATSCDKAMIKCPHCHQMDLRINFKNGKHQCPQRNDDEQNFSQFKGVRKSQDQINREQRLRALDDYHRGGIRGGDVRRRSPQPDESTYASDRSGTDRLTGPVSQSQIQIIKGDLQNVHSLITEDVFQMIDNLSQALTERDTEVVELRKEGKLQDTEIAYLRESQKNLEEQAMHKGQKISQLQSQLVQQSDRLEELISNLTQKQAQQMKRLEEQNQSLHQQIIQKSQTLQSQETRLTQLTNTVKTQADLYNEVIGKLGIKIEQQDNQLRSQDQLLSQLSKGIHSQNSQRSNDDEKNERKIMVLEKNIVQLKQELSTKEENQEALLAQVIHKFEKKITKVVEAQQRQDKESDTFQKFVIEQVKKSQQQEQIIKESSAEPLLKVQSSEPKKDLEAVDAEQKYQESMVSESLDEEIYKEHFQQQQMTAQKFQRNLKVPPIDFTGGPQKHKNSSSSLKHKKSPKNQKQFTEDTDIHQSQDLSGQMRNQFYPKTQPEQDDEAVIGNDLPEDEEAKEQQDKMKARRDKMAIEKNNNQNTSKAQIDQEGTAKEKVEEIEEDVDESQFIPAYLSSTENEMTDLNNTELNTEFNTTRNANNGGYAIGGGQSDRAHPGRSGRGSARGQGPILGGLTDRDKRSNQLNQSLPNQSMVSSYQLSQSTQRMESVAGDRIGQLNRSNDSQKDGSNISRDIDSENLLDNDMPRIDHVAIRKQSGQQQPIEDNTQENTRLEKQLLSGEHSQSNEESKIIDQNQPEDIHNNNNQIPPDLTQNIKDGPFHLQESSDFIKHHLTSQNENQPIPRNSDSFFDMENKVEEADFEQEQPEIINKKADDRKSIPRNSASPYNPSLIKTYESSEFEQGCPEMLPGTIFGQGQNMQSKLPIIDQLQEPLRSNNNTQDNNFNQNIAIPLEINSPLTQMSAQSKECQKDLQNHAEAQDKSQSRATVTADRTHMQTLVEGRITEFDSLLQRQSSLEETNDGINPYTDMVGRSGGSNQLMHQTLKVEKMKQENFIEGQDKEKYKQIENDILKLQRQYETDNQEPAQSKTQPRNIEDSSKSELKRGKHTTEERRKAALRDLEKTQSRQSQGQVSKTSNIDASMRQVEALKQQSLKRKNSQGSKDSDRQSDFERDDASNGENIDNIIHQILDGDDLFKQKKKEEKPQESSSRRIQKEDSGAMPFEVGSNKLSSAGNSDCQNQAQRESDPILKQTRQNSEIEKSQPRVSDVDNQTNQSQKEEEPIDDDQVPAGNNLQMPAQPIPSGLEDDLETILETDQESNYMTTARTNLQKSQVEGQVPSQNKTSSGAPSAQNLNQSHLKLNESIAQIPDLPDEEKPLNQSLMNKSLNDSSFILNDNPLPTNLFGYQSQVPGVPSNRLSQLESQNKEEQKGEENYGEKSEIFKTEKKQVPQIDPDQANSEDKQPFNSLMNDISPIAHALEHSRYQSTRFSNILDSSRTDQPANSNEKGQPEDKNISQPQPRNLQYKFDQGEEPSFLISDRSITVPDNVNSQEKPEDETPQGPKPPLVEAEEERIKQYQDKVLSAITQSAQKKQREQQDLLLRIEAQNEKRKTQNQIDQQMPKNEHDLAGSDSKQASKRYFEDIRGSIEIDQIDAKIMNKEEIDAELKTMMQKSRERHDEKGRDNSS